MNKLEEFVYHAISGNPTVKNFVRNTYQAFFDLLPRKREFIPVQISTAENCHFGFHDISQLSPDDSKLLVVRPSFDKRMPKAGEAAEIGYYDVDEKGRIGVYHSVCETFAWNWHKGSRGQWMSNDTILFNTCVNDKMVSQRINVITGEKIVYPFPIDSISQDGRFATTFSFERLQFCMPGYGYPYHDDSYLDQEAPCETGLYVYEFATKSLKLIVSIRDLIKTIPNEYQSGYMHFVTHTEFSHDGRYISFMHRWTQPSGNILKRKERLIVYDIELNEFSELPSELSASHYAWNKKHQIIASVVLGGKCCHALYDVHNINNVRVIAGDQINSDGHQSFINDSEFITDTYPDKYRNAYLYRVNIETGEVKVLARLFSPKEFQTKDNLCHIACDLHPRVSFSGKYYSFDTVRTGIRSVCLVKI